MLYRGLLLAAVFCLFFTTVLSVQCYTGTDNQCIIGPDMVDCGDGAKCYCAKYRFTCTADDGSCTKAEQKKHSKKWAYTVVTDDTCKAFKQYPNVYENAKCCTTNKCNTPESGKCTWSSFSRRIIERKVY